MKEISVEIEGIKPILLHRFGDEAQMEASSGVRSAIPNADRNTPSEIAEGFLYLDKKGVSGVPQPNLFRCFIDAGKFFKIGRSKVTTQQSSMIPAFVNIREEFIPIVSKGGWKVDTRPVRVPSTGGRVLCHRPCYDDWKLKFTIELDDSEGIGVRLMRDIVDAAGTRIGLGDFRPDRKGPFGKFKVIHWDVANGAK